jgi:hypothetical protein
LGPLAALKNSQPAQPVEEIKEFAVVGDDVVALDPLRASRNIRQEMADLARPAHTATFKNGVLKVVLPKTAEAQKPAKKIEVKSG